MCSGYNLKISWKYAGFCLLLAINHNFDKLILYIID